MYLFNGNWEDGKNWTSGSWMRVHWPIKVLFQLSICNLSLHLIGDWRALMEALHAAVAKKFKKSAISNQEKEQITDIHYETPKRQSDSSWKPLTNWNWNQQSSVPTSCCLIHMRYNPVDRKSHPGSRTAFIPRWNLESILLSTDSLRGDAQAQQQNHWVSKQGRHNFWL